MGNLIKSRNHYLGMTKKMNCGAECTVIDYVNSRNMTVKFDNGDIRTNVTTNNFRIGNVAPKNKPLAYNVGDTKLMNCGLMCTIIKMKGDSFIATLQFEDGTIQDAQPYSFKKGHVLPKSDKFSYATRPVFRLDDPREVYYRCTCKDCGEKFISKLINLKNHKCNKEV